MSSEYYTFWNFAALAGALLFMTYFFSRISGYYKRIVPIISILCIGLFYGLRESSIGVDTAEYLARYQRGTVTEDFIFSQFGVILKSLGVSSDIYLVLLAVITASLLYAALYNFTNNYTKSSYFLLLASFMPYGIMSYTNIMRQGLAVALILYAISVIAKKRHRIGYLLGLLTLYIHKATAIVYIISWVLAFFRGQRYFWFSVFSVTTILTILIAISPAGILSLYDPDTANKFLYYQEWSSSESPYLIYIKIMWALVHLYFIYRLNKYFDMNHNLFLYYVSVVMIAIIFISNTLISSRVLAAVDFILPVLYATYPINGKRTYLVGIIMLIIYALVSPLMFRMYEVNFNNFWM